jgi:Dullard-like phosphatase family protein
MQASERSADLEEVDHPPLLPDRRPLDTPASPLRSCSSSPVAADQDGAKEEKATLVLDLDETLIHSEVDPVSNETTTHQRPGLSHFLQQIAGMFEVVVFTAGLEEYASPIIDRLDPQGLIQHRLYRQHVRCIRGKHFTKDLARLNRPLSRVVIVDNSAESFLLHPLNAIPIEPYFGEAQDTRLLELLPLLQALTVAPDVREVLAVCHATNDFTCVPAPERTPPLRPRCRRQRHAATGQTAAECENRQRHAATGQTAAECEKDTQQGDVAAAESPCPLATPPASTATPQPQHPHDAGGGHGAHDGAHAHACAGTPHAWSDAATQIAGATPAPGLLPSEPIETKEQADRRDDSSKTTPPHAALAAAALSHAVRSRGDDEAVLEDAERLCQDRNDKRAAGASPWLRALRMPRGAVAPSQDEERGQVPPPLWLLERDASSARSLSSDDCADDSTCSGAVTPLRAQIVS